MAAVIRCPHQPATMPITRHSTLVLEHRTLRCAHQACKRRPGPVPDRAPAPYCWDHSGSCVDAHSPATHTPQPCSAVLPIVGSIPIEIGSFEGHEFLSIRERWVEAATEMMLGVARCSERAIPSDGRHTGASHYLILSSELHYLMLSYLIFSHLTFILRYIHVSHVIPRMGRHVHSEMYTSCTHTHRCTSDGEARDRATLIVGHENKRPREVNTEVARPEPHR